MRNLYSIVAILIIFPHNTYASWFENCKFRASLVSEVTEDEKNRKFKIEVLTAKSLGGHTDCMSYVNKIIDVEINHKEAKRYRQLAKGKTITIYRTESDYVTEDGIYHHFLEFRSRQ